MTKICSKCGEEKPSTTEYFGKMKSSKDGLRGQCKDCMKEYKKQYRKENKESIQQYEKQYYQENKEKRKEYDKQYHKENKEKRNGYDKQWRKENKEYLEQWRKENKEKRNEYKKQYRKENKEEIKEYFRQYRKENKEEIKEYAKKYRKENIDGYRQYAQERRASKKRLPHTLTIKQWQQIKDDFNNECAYCGMTEEEHIKRFNEQLHQEHFIPLSKGGEYTHNNIIPACKSCNCSKNNTDFFEWYPTYEYYNEEREQFILEYLGYIEDTQQLTLEVEVI